MAESLLHCRVDSVAGNSDFSLPVAPFRSAQKVKQSLLFNQNFFKDPRLVAEIVGLANFGPNDVVYEIGPGRGIITRELAKAAGKVVAVEIDKRLFLRLQVEFAANPQVKIINADWLNYRVPESNYKVFANIPFNQTADMVRKLLAGQGLTEAYLVVQKEAAEKFTGTLKSTQWSVSNQPEFEFEIVRHFQREDFFPRPGVGAVLLQISRRSKPLIEAKDKSDYNWLVNYGFNRWRANLGKNFKDVFTYNQWRRLAGDLKFPIKAFPGDLTFPQWLGIFKFHLTHK